MAVIWKTVLDITDKQIVKMPTNAEILCVKRQDFNICMWFRCNASASIVERSFSIRGTGNEFTLTEDIYIGTVVMDVLVWHVFENK